MNDRFGQNIQVDFLNALISGNYQMCSELIHQFPEKQNSIKEIYENIIRQSLYEIGELWEYNKISVATEHLASAIVESVLNEVFVEIVAKERKNKTVIVSCVENEFHQIGIKMVGDIFELNGWNTHFLGSNTPTTNSSNLQKSFSPICSLFR